MCFEFFIVFDIEYLVLMMVLCEEYGFVERSMLLEEGIGIKNKNKIK